MASDCRLKVRRAVMDDLPEMMAIFAHAREFMAAHGNPNQWGPTNWPPEDLIRQDIRDGSGYVCVAELPFEDADAGGNMGGDKALETGGSTDEAAEADEKIVGAFYYVSGHRIEPTYDVIEDGEWIGGDDYGVVHRIASSGNVKGVGSFCVNWAYEQCGHLRMDTHGDNKVMQSMLAKLGFVHCGTIYVEEDDYPRLAYEKI